MEHVFSDNEISILRLLIGGFKNKQIADDLNFSQAYVSQTVKKIRLKFNQIVDSIYLLQEMGILDKNLKLNIVNNVNSIFTDNASTYQGNIRNSFHIQNKSIDKKNKSDKFLSNDLSIKTDTKSYQNPFFDINKKINVHHLLKLDAKFGLIPALMSLLLQLQKKKYEKFDITDFIIDMRRLMVIEKLLSVDQNTVHYMISDITKPEYLIFESSPRANHFPRSFIDRIFEPLKNKKLLHSVKRDYLGRYIVNSDIDGLEPLRRYSVQELFTTSKDFYGYKKNRDISGFKNYNVLYEFENFTRRIDLTIRLLISLQNINLKNNFINSSLLNREYYEKLSLPLVGTMRQQNGSNVIYLLKYYEVSNKRKNLDSVDVEINDLILPILKHSDIQEILKECYYFSEDRERPFYYMKKLIARHRNSSGIFVIFMISFSKKIILSKQTHNPLHRLYNDIKHENNWEVYMSRSSFLSGEILLVNE